LKTVKSPYLGNGLTDRHTIWHSNSFCLTELQYASAYTALTILVNKTAKITKTKLASVFFVLKVTTLK